MFKKLLVVSGLIATLAVTPAYAQSVGGSSGNNGFFGKFMSFFAQMFHQNGQQGVQGDQNGQPVVSGSPTDMPSGVPSGMPNSSGTPNMLPGEQGRLNALVKQGKLTQAQEAAVLAEIQKVQAELKAWAVSQGIDPSYVLGPGLGIRDGGTMGGWTPSVTPTPGQGMYGRPQTGMMPRGGNQGFQGGQGGPNNR